MILSMLAVTLCLLALLSSFLTKEGRSYDVPIWVYQSQSLNRGNEMLDQVDKIMAYEQGELDEEGTIELFQELVNSGLAWQLQGHYGRTATALIEAGYITQPQRKLNLSDSDLRSSEMD